MTALKLCEPASWTGVRACRGSMRTFLSRECAELVLQLRQFCEKFSALCRERRQFSLACCRPEARQARSRGCRWWRYSPGADWTARCLRRADPFMSLQLGILLALLCAFASNLSFLYKHRGACCACDVDIRHPLRTRRLAVEPALVRDRHARRPRSPGSCTSRAISLAPLSVVQVVLSSGLVLLAVMADRLFGFKVGKRQWWGLALTFVGLVLLAITLPASHGAHSGFSVPAMVAFEAGLFGLGALCIMGPRLGGPAEHHGVMLAAAAGILFGVCNLGVKALTGVVGDGGVLGVVISPWMWVASPAPRPPSTPRRARCRSATRSRSSRSPAPPRTSRRSPAASSSSATRCPATRSASSCRPSPSCS